jgi:hypothetical protein
MFPFTNIDNQQYLDELAHEEQTIQTPQFKEDIKVFEKKIKETNSKFRIYNKYLNEKYTLYKELVTPHVEIIKGFKKEFIDTIRVSQEHKDFKNKSTSISFLLNKLCTKYKMPRYRLIKGSGLPSSRDIYCRSYYTAKILLLKKLRIRI